MNQGMRCTLGRVLLVALLLAAVDVRVQAQQQVVDRAKPKGDPTRALTEFAPSALPETPKVMPVTGPKKKPTSYRIAFVSYHGSRNPDKKDYQLYTMNGDGTGLKSIHNFGQPTMQFFHVADWSPDGKKVLVFKTRYEARTGNTGDFLEIDVASGAVRNLTNSPPGRFVSMPRYSPDGKKIAFLLTQGKPEPNNDPPVALHVMDPDGSNVRKYGPAEFFDWGPEWSPDGKYCFFASTPRPTSQGGTGNVLYRIDADGRNLTKFTVVKNVNNALACSPDGKFLAFATQGDGKFLDICVVNADGSGARRIPMNTTFGTTVQWSLDGTKLHYEAAESMATPVIIYSVNRDGSNRTKIYQRPASEQIHQWNLTPDGKKIIFSLGKTFVSAKLYAMNGDGSGVKPLTDVDAIKFVIGPGPN